MNSIKPRVVVNGQWLDRSVYGDLEWTNCWPGGTETITFGTLRSHRLIRENAIVQVRVGGSFVAAAQIRGYVQGDEVRAEGLFRAGEDFGALTSGGDVNQYVSDAVTQAVARGLPWAGYAGNISPVPGVTDVPLLNLDEPHSVSEYMDASAQQRGAPWGVGATRRAYIAGWEPADIHVDGLGGLAISRDGYASKLFGRFVLDVDGLWHTNGAEDVAATKRWGYAERMLSKPLGEGRPMSWAESTALLEGLLTQGRSQIGWTRPIEVEYGDIRNNRQQAVDLGLITDRRTVRLHGLTSEVGDLQGRSSIDVKIQRVYHRKDGTAVLEPVALSQPMNDALADAA